jgi:hypothetical protein
MVDHKNKVIYIHVAKTGGSSVTQFYGLNALEECRKIENWKSEHELNDIIYPRFNLPYSDGVHASMEELSRRIKEVHGEDYRDYKSFSVIRDPAEYVHSCWKEWHTERFPQFDGFISAGWFKHAITPQVQGHLTVDKKIAVDKIFLFDRLGYVFDHIRGLLETDHLGIPALHANIKSLEKDPIEGWLVNIINDWFYEDYNIYQSIKGNR